MESIVGTRATLIKATKVAPEAAPPAVVLLPQFAFYPHACDSLPDSFSSEDADVVAKKVNSVATRDHNRRDELQAKETTVQGVEIGSPGMFAWDKDNSSVLCWYFRMDPLPGRNALVPSQPGEKTVNYPARPVDQTADFEGTVPVQPSQPVSSANAASGNVAASVGPSRSMPRPIHMVGMQRMPNANMTSFNVASQAGIAPPNSGGLPLQRGGAGAHGHQQQLRRKDPGMGMQNPNYPQQKRRF
ncbi:hypothetical protein ZIOFF_015457 [Zingiber officinale]|uniref:Uncharacterized protein n=1 Tax=Zingiber officinale TaxID=94328 RepID=A0A8J5HD15_ZINOF|nr:hypothetical protein ZIOFF_015457 [Zingiber officinale]